ncbi:hypothetical protein [uncultured Citrobacter sp.]|uniref:hypothetical protein n=1 Tax=uncultured Citrobacter sp. TaxID=200446 RepID=UPI00266BB371|nr:hypothetical protein [uncultured Citrobacter sp.]
MSAFILFDKNDNTVVTDLSYAVEFLGVVYYRPDGIFERNGSADRDYHRFYTIQCSLDGVTIAFSGEKPTQEEIDDAVRNARITHPWKFTRH